MEVCLIFVPGVVRTAVTIGAIPTGTSVPSPVSACWAELQSADANVTVYGPPAEPLTVALPDPIAVSACRRGMYRPGRRVIGERRWSVPSPLRGCRSA